MPPPNPRLAWMDKPVHLTLNGGENGILIGLVTREWSEVRQDPNRKPYFETLDRLRKKLFQSDPK